MADTYRNGKRIYLRLLLGSYILANLLNIYAIVKYGTPWRELATQQGYVVCITLVFFGLAVAGFSCRRLVCRPKRNG